MFQFQNSYYEFHITPQRLISYKQKGVELLSSEQLPLFFIRLMDRNGDFVELDAEKAGTVTEQGNRFIYENFGLCDIRVELVFSCTEVSPLISFGISIANNTDYAIESVNYPQVCVEDRLVSKGGNYKILWPFNEGVIIEDMSVRPRTAFPYIEPSYPSHGIAGFYPGAVESQLMAYYNGETGLYFAAHDPTGSLKVCECFSINEKQIKLHYRAFTGCTFGEDYTMPYPMILGCFEGEWQDAAEIYRNWFESNLPDGFVRIDDNDALPDWYKDSPLVVIYPVRGHHDSDVMAPNTFYPYENALPYIEKYAKETDSRIMALLMHWEGSAPWAPPYVWPPYGSLTSFLNFSDELHKKGHLLGVYCSGFGYTDHSGLTYYSRRHEYITKNLEAHMCASPKGNVEQSTICRGLRYGYDLCPSASFTNEVLTKEVDGVLSGNVDYIQLLDQNHGGLSTMCYSRFHGHPPVPGKWQIDAIGKLMTNLRELAVKKGRKLLIGCESAAGEALIPDLQFNDCRFNLNYIYGYPVPLYSYLYHPYINNFMGNQVCASMAFNHEKDPLNLLYRMAYSYASGDMMSIVMNTEGKIAFNWGIHKAGLLPDQKSITTFIRNANCWRQSSFKKYLLHGKMLKPIPILDCTTIDFTHPDGRIHKADCILTSRWIAGDGSIAQFFINYDITEHSCTIDYKNQNASLYMACDGEMQTISGISTIQIPPLSVIVIVEK